MRVQSTVADVEGDEVALLTVVEDWTVDDGTSLDVLGIEEVALLTVVEDWTVVDAISLDVLNIEEVVLLEDVGMTGLHPLLSIVNRVVQ